MANWYGAILVPGLILKAHGTTLVPGQSSDWYEMPSFSSGWCFLERREYALYIYR